MRKTITLVAVCAAWVAIAGCERETMPNDLGDSLPRNESSPEEPRGDPDGNGGPDTGNDTSPEEAPAEPIQ